MDGYVKKKIMNVNGRIQVVKIQMFPIYLFYMFNNFHNKTSGQKPLTIFKCFTTQSFCVILPFWFQLSFSHFVPKITLSLFQKKLSILKYLKFPKHERICIVWGMFWVCNLSYFYGRENLSKYTYFTISIR